MLEKWCLRCPRNSEGDSPADRMGIGTIRFVFVTDITKPMMFSFCFTNEV
jgi:hypothetical protein